MRLVARCLNREINLASIGEPILDEKYEAQLVSFLPEHPFITGRRFRNAIFEALALAELILSPSPEAVQLALTYSEQHKYNYHLVYLLHLMARDQKIPIDALRLVIGAALEFRSRTASVEIEIEACSNSNTTARWPQAVEIQVEVVMGVDEDRHARAFLFFADLIETQPVVLGSRLSSTYVLLPGEVALFGAQELEFTAPVLISADKIGLQSPTLTVRPTAGSGEDNYVVLEAERIESTVGNILTNGAELVLAVGDRIGMTYPAIRYVTERNAFGRDAQMGEKYLRLRRILGHFRSHSKGALAKYKHKIEHERVAVTS
jgi:hypothetical protein